MIIESTTHPTVAAEEKKLGESLVFFGKVGESLVHRSIQENRRSQHDLLFAFCQVLGFKNGRKV